MALSAILLLGLLLQGLYFEWQSHVVFIVLAAYWFRAVRLAWRRMYFDMRAYLEWKQAQPVAAVSEVAAAAVAAS